MKESVRYMIGAFGIFLCLGCSTKNSNEYPFRDESLTIEQRVEDLVSRLTLEEKVSQMVSNAAAIERLGIPAYDWQNECLHGVGKVADYKVTVFPQPIGMAAAWDVEAMHQVADCISEEGRAIYHDALKRGIVGSYYGLTYWAPNINIFRDPRWGRGHETYGEDPYLTAALGKAFVEGLQGNDSIYLKSSACVKHYAVHSGPESLRHKFTTEVSTYDLWDTYLPAFRDVIVDGKATGVMCAYNAYSGKPCCGNDLLMSNILRNKWNFKGYVTSDCGAIDDFYKEHKTHPDTISAAVDAVLHGTDLDCIRDVAFKTLVQAVRENRIKEEYIDNAVKRLFTIRFRLGMFDKDASSKWERPLSVLESQEHQALARKVAQESIVLLKNNQNILPLRKDLRKLAVIGPNANVDLDLLGNYHGYPSDIVTVLEGIKGKISSNTSVYYKKMVDYLAIDDFVPLDVQNMLSYQGKKGFHAEYFNNGAFDGIPEVKQENEVELHYMGETDIAKGVSSLDFSVRYVTYFRPQETSEYTLNLDTDKRFRLYVEDKLCIDASTGKAKAEGKYIQRFEAGKMYKIKFEVMMKGRHGNLSFQIGKTVSPSIEQLAEQVKDADAIVFVGGISPSLEGEENGVHCKGFKDGDRTTIALPEIQTQFMKALVKTGKPVIFVLMTGSAISINWEDAHVPAILNVWYGGQATGEAVADVLFGDYNPSGRLPVTFYKSDNDLPPFTDYSMENRTYRYFKGKVLYPFGYGLSYTTFNYANLTSVDRMATTDSLEVQVDVTNTGLVKGDEVVQLYVKHIAKEDYLPIRALKGFARVSLMPGETKTVCLKLSPRDLATYNDFGECCVRSGEIKISVGGGQPGGNASFVEKKVLLQGGVNMLPM